MTKVFIAGSIGIKSLDLNVLSRINNIITSGFDIVVGDADGVDSLAQRYLFEKQVRNVTVFYCGEAPRNNVGKWAMQKVSSKHTPNTRAFFTAKDIEMAKSSDYGFMVWDCKSTGTLSNIIELLSQGKSSLVYINKARNFLTISNHLELEGLLKYMSKSAVEQANRKISLKKKIESFQFQHNNLFSLAR